MMSQSEDFSYDDYDSAEDSVYRPSPEVEIDSEETPNDIHIDVNNKGKSKVVAEGTQKNKKKRAIREDFGVHVKVSHMLKLMST
ncbi:hypothetical protein L195_g010421 [Trifolium pratense]|uniref:Uncharacterized protein n=1 Tax=Trifolium pratense TaxID=57577 RepID=A0A2K3PEV4_TRIPR|nr:hypothetical protein L195_g010421 [Trifolium pratense]